MSLFFLKLKRFIKNLLKRFLKTVHLIKYITFAVIWGILIIEFFIRLSGFIYKNLNYVTNRNKMYPIYIIGGSTSQGEPYEQRCSILKIINYIFKGKIINKPIKIVNLALGGENLEWSYWKLYKNLFFYPPKEGLLIIYSGVNDHLGIDFKPQLKDKIQKFLQNFVLISKIMYLLNPVGCNSLEYENLLNKVIKLARSYKLHVIICAISGNWKFPPQESELIISNKQFKKFFDRGLNYEKKGKIQSALSIYMRLYKNFGR
ncbi:MAG: hypothetical protein ACTSQP_24610 [Promethearchaeota archaeon]